MSATTGGPGSARARLRLAGVALLALLAAAWAFVGLRLYFLPPAGVPASVGALLGLPALLNAVAYGLSAGWVARRVRRGHLLGTAVAGLNLLLGFTAAMTWVEWTLLGVNLLALGALLGSVPRRS